MWFFFACRERPLPTRTAQTLVCSIEPLSALVEELTQPWATCASFVPKGSSPETFEPLPNHLQALQSAHAYITLGLPFELHWLSRLEQLNPHLRMLDLSASFTQLSEDPHLWLSPQSLMYMTQQLSGYLQAAFPERRALITQNTRVTMGKLTLLDGQLRETIERLSKSGSRALHFASYHPAWQRVTQDYGLTEHSLFNEGKEPSPLHLKQFQKLIAEHQIKKLFVPLEFKNPSVEALAQQFKLQPVYIDILSRDLTPTISAFIEAMAQGL